MLIFSALLISMFISIALIPILRVLALKINVLDIPDGRKVHSQPMPKTGGLAMAAGVLLPVVLWTDPSRLLAGIFAGSFIIVVTGLIDDIRTIDYLPKLAGQVAAAGVVIFFAGIRINSIGTLLPEGMSLPVWLSVAITFFVIVGVTNAINLSDGLDGLAGGICLLSFLCIAYLAYQSGQWPIALISVAVTGAIFGFLRFNSYPAVVFMGDTGSQFLGFLSITLSVHLTQADPTLSPILPLILLGFPVLDTLAVIVERLVHGRHLLRADKNHFHHKLLRLGLYHTEAVFLIYLFQAVLVTFAYLFRYYSDGFLLAVYATVCGAILAAVYTAEKCDFRFSRKGFFDISVKGRLRAIKEMNLPIKISFKIVESGMPLLLLLPSIMASGAPTYMGIVAFGAVFFIFFAWMRNPMWLDISIRLSVYLLVPFVIYFSEIHISGFWGDETAMTLYHFAFGALILFVMLTLRFTRRSQGFKTSPFDFLILFIAVVIPNLPDPGIRNFQLGMIAAKIIVLFFSFEVLMGELRGKITQISMWIVLALSIFAIKNCFI